MNEKQGEKGDWLDLIFERWGFFIGDKNNFKDEIRKGHEAELHKHIDEIAKVNDDFTHEFERMYKQIEQLKSDLEAARKAEDMAEESKQKCLKIIKKLEQEIARIAFLVE